MQNMLNQELIIPETIIQDTQAIHALDGFSVQVCVCWCLFVCACVCVPVNMVHLKNLEMKNNSNLNRFVWHGFNIL